MAQLPLYKMGFSATTLTYAAANAGGDTFANNGSNRVHVKNGQASAITATIKGNQPCSQGVLHDQVITIPASSEVVLGPFAPGRFNDSNGNVTIQYSSVTSVTHAVLTD